MSFVRLSLALGIIIPSYLGLLLRGTKVPLGIKENSPLIFLNFNLGLNLTQRNPPIPAASISLDVKAQFFRLNSQF